jgi:UDP-N-acetylmuramyl pentapeptide phosphotransferase/UDP-N-acetylglucosamine-1-phosphate transferase
LLRSSSSRGSWTICGAAAWAKLGAQLGAAGLALWSGLTVELVSSDWIAVPLGVIWLVGMTNAFNLLDNMDGLAATLAAIAAVTSRSTPSTVHPNDTVLVLALSLGLACVGFLRFNLRAAAPPRRSWATRAARCSASRSRARLLTSYKVAGSTVATLLCRS